MKEIGIRGGRTDARAESIFRQPLWAVDRLLWCHPLPKYHGAEIRWGVASIKIYPRLDTQNRS